MLIVCFCLLTMSFFTFSFSSILDIIVVEKRTQDMFRPSSSFFLFFLFRSYADSLFLSFDNVVLYFLFLLYFRHHSSRKENTRHVSSILFFFSFLSIPILC